MPLTIEEKAFLVANFWGSLQRTCVAHLPEQLVYLTLCRLQAKGLVLQHRHLSRAIESSIPATARQRSHPWRLSTTSRCRQPFQSIPHSLNIFSSLRPRHNVDLFERASDCWHTSLPLDWASTTAMFVFVPQYAQLALVVGDGLWRSTWVDRVQCIRLKNCTARSCLS